MGQNRQLRRELQDTVAQVDASVPIAVVCGDVEVALLISRRTPPGLPNAAATGLPSFSPPVRLSSACNLWQ